VISDALAIVCGLLVGILSGLIGVGGGVLLVPIMVIGFGFGQHLAQGTSLAAVLPTSAVGAATHYRLGHLKLTPALVTGTAGAVAAVGSGIAAQFIQPGILARLFGLFLLFSAYRLWPRGSRRPVQTEGGN
jgi:uncharacterized membrane protein YfcA